jgi:hypothetical protein
VVSLNRITVEQGSAECPGPGRSRIFVQSLSLLLFVRDDGLDWTDWGNYGAFFNFAEAIEEQFGAFLDELIVAVGDEQAKCYTGYKKEAVVDIGRCSAAEIIIGSHVDENAREVCDVERIAETTQAYQRLYPNIIRDQV